MPIITKRTKMKPDLIEKYYKSPADNFGGEMNGQAAGRQALCSVLPQIIKNELTPRQQKCLKMKYGDKLTQKEIAEKLHLSQPTVSRHIESAKSAVNNRLIYCLKTANKVNSAWCDYIIKPCRRGVRPRETQHKSKSAQGAGAPPGCATKAHIFHKFV